MLDIVHASKMTHIMKAGIKEETIKIVVTEATMVDLAEDTRVVIMKMTEASKSSVSSSALA